MPGAGVPGAGCQVPGPGADISTSDLFLEKLLRELELALENQRWYDLVRTGKFIEELLEVELAYHHTTGTAQVVH